MSEVSYDKLWKKLEENNMKKTDLYLQAHISTNAIAKMGRNEDVRVNILVKICKFFNCKFDDIVEITVKQFTAQVVRSSSLLSE